MRSASLRLLAVCAVASAAAAAAPEECQNLGIEQPPFITPTTWLPASVPWRRLKTYNVTSYMAVNETLTTCDATTGETDFVYRSAIVGEVPTFTDATALQVLDVAVETWKGGAGVWTAQYTTQQRVDAVRNFFKELAVKREDIVTILMWEIGKNRVDAEAEFDRTVQFAEQLMDAVTTDPEFVGKWEQVPGTPVTALTKRAAIGVILALAPYNYPINESYATILPALLTGNIVILKIPMVGGLAHLLTMEALAKSLPPGVMNFISGRGRAILGPIMESGKIDGLAFIGSGTAADALVRSHPHPHRLKLFLQLEAKNMGIMLPDLFEESNSAALENALDEAILGALSFNGQRCTALKIFFAPKEHAEDFAMKLVERVEAMTMGSPWQKHTKADGTQAYSQITPLPDFGRVGFMNARIKNAERIGALVANSGGGTILGGSQSTLMVPAILYPVTPDMGIYTEEQFGPIIPVAIYDDLETVLLYGETGQYGQQVSVFGQDVDSVARILDRFGAVFGKVNLNAQCGRSPDTLAFSGRRSSAMGIMSVKDILREFSVPTVVAYKSNAINDKLVQGLNEKSTFLGATNLKVTK